MDLPGEGLDLSASADNSFNLSCFQPRLAQSTPKKRKFDWDLSSSSVSLNVTGLSIPDVEDAENRKDQRRKKVQFKVPKNPAKQFKPKHICPDCGKTYICQSSFKNHIVNHKLQDAASRYPDKEAILNGIVDIGKSSLNAVTKVPSVGEEGAKFQNLVRDILSNVDSDDWKNFLLKLQEMILESAVGVKFLLPSKLLSVLTDQAEKILSDRENHLLLLSLLNLPPVYCDDFQSQFLLEFVFAFIAEILCFISSKICGEDVREGRQVEELDRDDRGTVYYIGGSIMRGYFRLSHRFKGSHKWMAISDCLQENVLTDQPVGDCNWTESLDRGGLLYITRDCQDFFIRLTKVVFALEKRDGSIDFEKVIASANNSYIAVLWDKMFSDNISEVVSLNFMNDVIKSFCRTCGRGFAKRRLNNLRRGPVISMPTRHLVASRKTK